MPNWLFADGHVKSIKPTRTVEGNVNMWNKDPSTAPSATQLSWLACEENLLASR
jgi:hypothetical protein